MSKIFVLIVDDHKILVEGLRSLINQNSYIQAIGEAENGKDAITLCKDLKPNIVLMDLDMPILNGIEATKIITIDFPQSKVIILSMYPDHKYVQSALKAGAKGFLVKDTVADDLIQAIRVVNGGKAFFSPSVSKIIIESMYIIENSKFKEDMITSREKEILQLVTEGKSSNQISELLFISKSTVNKHRENLMKKLNIHDIAGLIRYAIQKGKIYDKKPKNL